jgi:hypothetical protein
LLGISCSHFGEAEGGEQTSFAFDDEGTVDLARIERRAAVERAMDDVRDRFGSAAVKPAALVQKKEQK